MNKLSRHLTLNRLAPSDLKELIDAVSTTLFNGIYYDKCTVVNSGGTTHIFINLLTGLDLVNWGIDGVFTIEIGADGNRSIPVSISYTSPRIFSMVSDNLLTTSLFNAGTGLSTIVLDGSQVITPHTA